MTNHTPQRILNVKRSPEVKGLSSSDRQEFKPELWCFLAMCLVGRLSLLMMKVKRLFQGRRTLMSITVRSAQYRLLETPLPGASSTAPHHTFLFPFPLYPFLLFPLRFPDTQKHRFLSNLSPVHLMLAWIIPQFASPSVSLFTSSPPVGSTINPTSPNMWQCLVSM